MFQVGFFAAIPMTTGMRPADARHRGRGVLPNALHKFLRLGDERLHSTVAVGAASYFAPIFLNRVVIAFQMGRRSWTALNMTMPPITKSTPLK